MYSRQTKGEKRASERLKGVSADIKEIEYLIKIGEYLPRSDLAAIWTAMLSRFSERVRSLGAGCGGLVAMEKDPAKCAEIINERAEETLKELSATQWEHLGLDFSEMFESKRAAYKEEIERLAAEADKKKKGKKKEDA